MDKTRFSYLFHQYVKQQCSPTEYREFLQAVIAAKNEEQLRDLLSSMWENASSTDKLDAQQKEKILSQILQSEAIKYRKSWIYKIAASIIFILLSGAIVLLTFDHQKNIESTASLEVPVNENKRIELPDGSIVWLTVGSSLDFPSTFNTHSREVYLIGEGYFDIRHDIQKEFIVHTGDLKTTVLGTAFNIRAYDSDRSITVTVTRGKVKVSDETQVFGIISRDQQITFDKAQHKVEQRAVKSDGYVAWAERDILFDDLTLEEAVYQLEKRFNISIDFSNPETKKCRFTATFANDESIQQILDVICEFHGVSYTKKEENKYTITGKGCL